MATEGLNLKAAARVKLTKHDEHGNVIEVIEKEIDLTRKEAEELWHSQQQA